MVDKILFVDDEENVLSALKRQFRKQYSVSVAAGGAEALQIIENDGPFAVIVSDMQMPEMNGVQFLQAAQKLAPETVRLMLTGNADQKTAVDAVNQGAVFSFYTKPCSQELMSNALQKAVEQYHLITAERELLEGTLNGSVKLLMDMLSMVAPEAFGKTVALQEMVEKISTTMQLKDTWHLKLAAMLSNIAYVTLPPETLVRACANEPLTTQEKDMVARLPEVGKNLISNIPRLERVAEIVLYQQKAFSGGGFPDDACAGEDIPLESRILKVLTDLELHKSQGKDYAHALKAMAAESGIYDPEVLKALAKTLASGEGCEHKNATVDTTLNGLRAGNVLLSNIETVDGKVLFAAGHKITETILQRLLNYNQITKIKEPILISIDGKHDTLDDVMAVAV